MVEDYLTDRDQEEALRTWWRDNWRWIIGGVVLGLALLGGWRYWEAQRDLKAQRAAKAYDDFHVAIDKRDTEQATRLLADMTAGFGKSAYTQQGRLLLAKAQADAGKIDEAIALLRSVTADSTDKELAEVARLRTARLLIQQSKYDEAIKLLDADKAGAFEMQVREVRGDAMVARGDQEGARAEYAAALAAHTADPRVDRSMIELKLQDVGGGKAATAPTSNPTLGKGQP